ncbi:MAG: phenylalanine--tRNA ligase subunit alpha [Candidatus Glassbacteria bacterium]|nr:phenylalanine--tRNA ligase subunit alpha [Candidatus Glassbacteria bacterium]
MSDFLQKIEQVEQEARGRIAGAGGLEALEALRLEYLGRKGKITRVLHSLGSVSAGERPALGKRANQVKEAVSGLLDRRRGEMEQARLRDELSRHKVDVTLPGERPWSGSIHPLNQTLARINEVFFSMGFALAVGPEVEDDFHNFDALNTPADHPARDEHDTFYLEGGLLLRSHTSPVQVRYMQNNPPPVRIIAPGRVFRRDTSDASHSPVFHQVEGLYVDEHVAFGDLKYTLEQFARLMFGDEVRVRFRPSFFPFTEPSAEVDCLCVFCKGSGCSVCGQSGWIELLGCGMVHPNVFEAVGYDPERWTGFAFGMGIDRICMLLNDINDIRLLLESDVEFLSQF